MERKLPDNWVEIPLGEVVFSKKGKKPENTIDTPMVGYDPYILIHEMEGGDFRSYTNDTKVPRSTIKDILLVWDGSIGKCTSGISGAIGSTIVSITPLGDIPTKFIEFFIKNQNSYILQNSTGTGLQHINKNFFNKCMLPLPPLPEQNRIVSKLDGLFAHLEEVSSRVGKLPTVLADLRQKLLSEAFNGELTKNWRKANNIDKWNESKMLELITSIQAGKNFKCPEIPVEKGKVGLVKISAVTWGEFNPKETKTVVDQNRIKEEYFIHQGDFLISRANTLELVGASVIVKAIEHDIMISDKVWRVGFKKDLHKAYINYYLKSRQGRGEIESRASGNQASMRNLSQNNFKEISVPIPPDEEIQMILKILESNFLKINNIENTLSHLQFKVDKLPEAILIKAFSGKLVEQLPSDGDATELLKEIEKLKKTPVKKNQKTKSKKNYKATVISEKVLREEIKTLLKDRFGGINYPELLKLMDHSNTRKGLINEIIQKLILNGVIEQVFDEKKETMKFKLSK